MNVQLNDKDIFIDNMNKLGYNSLADNFLVKQFNDLQINVTYRDNEVTAITGYDSQSEVKTIPEDVINQVQEDINNSI